MKRLNLVIHGQVQGVFYRHNTKKKADELNLKGCVKNLPDGSVEVTAEGPDNKLQQLLEWCHKGSDNASVNAIDVEWQSPKSEFEDFSIRYL